MCLWTRLELGALKSGNQKTHRLGRPLIKSKHGAVSCWPCCMQRSILAYPACPCWDERVLARSMGRYSMSEQADA
eukprot:163648-Pleurochrysis_carterae.AAC.2